MFQLAKTAGREMRLAEPYNDIKMYIKMNLIEVIRKVRFLNVTNVLIQQETISTICSINSDEPVAHLRQDQYWIETKSTNDSSKSFLSFYFLIFVNVEEKKSISNFLFL